MPIWLTLYQELQLCIPADNYWLLWLCASQDTEQFDETGTFKKKSKRTLQIF